MSRLVLAQTPSEPSPPPEGGVAVYAREGVLYAWNGASEPTPISGGGGPTVPAYWTAQFALDLTSQGDLIEAEMSPPYSMLLPVIPAGSGLLAFGPVVIVEENTLDVPCVVSLDATRVRVEVPAGDTGRFVAPVLPVRPLPPTTVFRLGVSTDDPAQGRFVAYATLTFMLATGER